MQTAISFVRHGHVYNPDNVYYGRLAGYRLSSHGIRQAKSASLALRDEHIVAVYSSPLKRARQTARIILDSKPQFVVSLSRLLLEVNSPYDGHPTSELEARHWDVYTGSPPPYEQPADVLNRAREFISLIRSQYSGKHVVAVTHGDLIAFLILWALDASITPLAKDDLRQWGFQEDYPAPGSITTLIFKTALEDELPGLHYQSA
jgi:broad specificity phosphatase PhoE